MNSYFFKIKQLCDFEKKNNLFERTYNGVHYWQWLRFPLITMYLRPSLDETCEKKKVIKRNLCVDILKSFFLDICVLIGLKKSDIMYFANYGSVRIIDGQKKDIYFDYFEFDDIYPVQICYYSDYNRKYYKNGSISTAIPKIKWILKKPLYKIFHFYNDKRENHYIVNLVSKLNNEFGLNLSLNEFIANIRNDSVGYKEMKKFYSSLLKRVSPKAIILVDHYNFLLYPMYEEAHQQGIPVIELQHGIVNPHPAYYYEDKLVDGKSLPDYFFVWGDIFLKSINVPDFFKPISIGYPFAEKRKEHFSKVKQDTKSIVFFLDSLYYEEECYEKMIVEFAEMIRNQGYKIFCKLHPSDKIENHILLSNLDECTIIPDDYEIYEISAMVKFYIAMNSTALVETLVFDGQRFVYNNKGSSYVLQLLIDNNLARCINSAQDLYELIQIDMQNNPLSINVFFTKNARENGQNALKRIINKE